MDASESWCGKKGNKESLCSSSFAVSAQRKEVSHRALYSLSMGALQCTHRFIDPAAMKSVSQDLTKLFLLSYKTAVPVVFENFLHKTQDAIVRSIVLSFLDTEDTDRLESYFRDRRARESLVEELLKACERELGEWVMRLATEDVYDLVCDLSTSHGRTVAHEGPPCACVLTECTDCLHSLVSVVQDTPPSRAKKMTKTFNKSSDLFGAALKDGRSDSLPEVGTSTHSIESIMKMVANAWDAFNDMYWKACSSVKPAQLDTVKQGLKLIKSTDGITLWYAVAARELKAMPIMTKGKGKQEAQSKACSACTIVSDLHLDKFRAASFKDRMSAWAYARKVLATVCREQGNASYSRSRYGDAVEHYSRAIGYDDEEIIFPLNRAACFIKLRQYREAEADCSAAIMLDCCNHKAWFRRGISRAGLGDVELAYWDFEKVLWMHVNDEKLYEEFRILGDKVLQESAKQHGLGETANSRIPDGQGGKRKKQCLHQLPLQKELLMLKENRTQRKKEDFCKVDVKKCRKGDKALEESSDGIVVSAAYSTGMSIVAEVFEQVMFAMAFSQIVRQKTGVTVKIPLEGWNRKALRRRRFGTTNKFPREV